MKFDHDYFERGLQTGISTYMDYRWMPEMTIPLAHELILLNGITKYDTILDFGCAKGYLVKAFRLLKYGAWGTDISDYALAAAPQDVKKYLFDWKDYQKITTPENNKYDWIIAKDVFEHIPPRDLILTLAILGMITENMFVIVPLGKNGRYNADLNNQDLTHVICEDFKWWENFFKERGWEIIKSTTSLSNIKQAYFTIPYAHGFFTLKAK